MNWKNTTDRYGSLSIAMHWLMLLLLAAVYACIELREFYPRGSDPREALKAWHFMLGLAVLVLVAVRLALRLAGPVPRIHPRPGALQHGAAAAMHGALYLFMIAMPLLGWLTLGAEGKAVEVLGWRLPALVGADAWLADAVGDAHETLATVGYYLVGLHAAAALVHHYIIRDDTLRRMLPRGRGEQIESGG